jgi:hypothetical protein
LDLFRITGLMESRDKVTVLTENADGSASLGLSALFFVLPEGRFGCRPLGR